MQNSNSLLDGSCREFHFSVYSTGLSSRKIKENQIGTTCKSVIFVGISLTSTYYKVVLPLSIINCIRLFDNRNLISVTSIMLCVKDCSLTYEGGLDAKLAEL